jgi:outer membrane lipase/esterase
MIRSRLSTTFATVLVAASAWLLQSCGGGTSQIEAFKPSRVIAFGDETSAITADGRKYAVNGFAADGSTRDCTTLPLWTQVVARAYEYGFPECPVGTGTQAGLSRAAVGARAAELVQQVDAQVAAGGFTNKDLVLVLVGLHDILELYGNYPTQSEAELTSQARERGERVAAQVNRMADLGAKVIVATTPDVGVSPYGSAQKAANTDTDRAALLSRLTAAFNGRVRVNILNDGRFVGLVLADEMTQLAARAPGLYSLSNATAAACKADALLPDCSTATLIDGATAAGYMWADGQRLGAGGHARLGALAESRARNNPF